MKEIELPVAELKKALPGLGKVIDKSASLPVLRCVRVNARGNGKVSLEGTNLDEFAAIEISGSGTGEALVDYDELNRLVKTCSSSNSIRVKHGDDRTALQYPIGSNHAEKTLPHVATAEWPKLPKLKLEQSLEVKSELKMALRQAFDCSSDDDTRYVLQGACLDVTDLHAHYVVGTNGRVLFSANSFSFPLQASIIVPNRKLLQWNGLMEDGTWIATTVSTAEQGKWLQVKSDRWTYFTKLIDGNYPNWKQILPSEPAPTMIRFNEDAVLFLISAIPKLPLDPKDVNETVLLVAEHGNILIQAKANPTDSYTSLPVVGATLEGGPMTVAMNRTFLLRAMRFGLSELELRDPHAHAVFKNNGKRMVIAMLRQSEAPTPPQPINPPVQTSSSPEPAPKPEETERKTMPETVNRVEKHLSATQTAEQPASSFDQLKDQIKSIKDNLKGVVVQLDEVLKVVTQAYKEKRASEKEIESIRESLQEIQRIKI
ncbi:MAG: hypothetical protein ACK4UN_08040 [Limisphaerales bacterium]